MFAAALSATLVVGASSSNSPPIGVASAAAVHAASSKAVVLVREPDRTPHSIAFSRGYLVWESGGEDETDVAALRQRDLRTGRLRLLAQPVISNYGLAATASWVVYAGGGGATTLFAVRHDGSGRHVLSRQLVAPIASRGELVAWAEQDQHNQRVFVRNMATGTRWLAARVPRCVGGRCYRIDAVTLAERGVVFARGAIGPQPSLIVRRAFTDKTTTSRAVPHDPQPDLAPSSAGALYYVFGRGWYRWDFGQPHPQPTRFQAAQQPPVLRFEHGDWFVRTVSKCGHGLLLIRADGSKSELQTSKRVIALAHINGRGCADLLDLTLSRTRAISGWAFRLKSADPYPVEVSLLGLVLSQPYRR